MKLNKTQEATLLKLAKFSILYGLEFGEPLPLNHPEVEAVEGPLLRSQGAAFVTLNKRHQLRGCIGSIQAYRPLIEDVVNHAYDAAFKDPRFPPLQAEEVADLTIEISVLTPPERMAGCETYEELLAQLQPGVDGLILTDGLHQATFLPTVWEQLPDKQQFVLHLMQKAGMRSWSPNMQCYRYHTLSFEAQWNEISID